jgi:hypothetical protein
MLLSAVNATGSLLYGAECRLTTTESTPSTEICGTTASCCMKLLDSPDGTAVDLTMGMCVAAGTAKNDMLSKLDRGTFVAGNYYAAIDCNMPPESYNTVFENPTWAEIMASIW